MNSQHKRKMHTRIRDSQRFVVEPTFRFLGILIENFIGCIFIPVVGFLGIGIRNTLGINPISGLLILRVVDLGGRIDRGREIFEKVATLLAFAIY